MFELRLHRLLCLLFLFVDILDCQSVDSCEGGYAIFYDFTYCLSDTSFCSQCQPCWNNHTALSTTNGSIYFCDEYEACDNCTRHCQNYQSTKYSDYATDNCGSLSNFIEDIETSKTAFSIDDVSQSDSITIACPSSTVLSIEWASLVFASLDCKTNIASSVSDQCDGEATCDYLYANETASFCTGLSHANITIEIGAHCTRSNTLMEYTGSPTVESNSGSSDNTALVVAVALIGVFSLLILIFVGYRCYRKHKKHTWAAQGPANDKGGSETVPSRQPSDVGPDQNTYVPPATAHVRGPSVQISINENDAPYNRRGSESFAAPNLLNNPQFPAVTGYKAYDGSNVNANQQRLGVQYTIDVPASNQPIVFDLVNPQLEDDYGELVPRQPYPGMLGGHRNSFSANNNTMMMPQSYPQGQQPPQMQSHPSQHQAYAQQQGADAYPYQQSQQQMPYNQYGMQQGPQGPYYPQQQAAGQPMAQGQGQGQGQGGQGQGQQYPQYMHNGPLYNPNTNNGSFERQNQNFLPNNGPGPQITAYNQNNFNGNGGGFVDANGVFYANTNVNGNGQMQGQPGQQPGQGAQGAQGGMYNDPNGNGMVASGTDGNPQAVTGAMQNDQSQPVIVPIAYGEILFEAELGRGGSTKVFKARWRNNPVAVKRFRTEDVDEKKAQILIDEITEKGAKLFESPHMLQIYGYCKNQTSPFCLVTEYMDQGSVKNYVRKDRPGATSISTLERLEIALQAAKGLQKLHDNNVIHRDIAARNILYSTHNDYPFNKRVVIADYGLSRILNDEIYSATYTNVGPLKWMAPEAISDFKFSKESDMYSFGITVWELLTGQDPYPDVDPVNTAVEVLVKQRRPQLEHLSVPADVKKLLKGCWDNDASKRLPIEKVVKVLTEFIDKEKKLLETNDEFYDEY